ncbi:MAG: hypothetical protein HYR96_09880 [Deltaproteobacteria bacterium]|nr:hypothetical protein [Deltaproteobacteria bacterium]MBI3294403.1 hypothetical protein [Deltaproteobacteria bacterium]
MRMLLVFLVSATGWAKVTINPGTQNVVPGQCVSFRAHFSGPTEGGKVREIALQTDQKALSLFASGDCSGSNSTTISGDKQDFNFSVQPASTAGGKMAFRLLVTNLNEIASASITILH